jgi:hypothetical protein
MARTGIVVPAYDPDVGRLRSYLTAIHETLDPDQVRVEVDAPDPSVLERLERTPASVHAVDNRRGKGAAIAAGFDALETDRLAFADADGSTPVSSLEAVLDGLADAAVSVGSRRHPDATVHDGQSPVRALLGDAFAWSARRMLPVSLSDYQCGAKAVTAQAWSQVGPHLSESGFAWDVELVTVAHRLGFDVVEVPVDWRDHPDSSVDPIPTAVELGRALVDLRRRPPPTGAGAAVDDHPSETAQTPETGE